MKLRFCLYNAFHIENAIQFFGFVFPFSPFDAKRCPVSPELVHCSHQAMENLSTARFADTPIRKLPAWISQNMTSYAGIRRTFGTTFLNFQHSQRYKFPGPVAPLFVIFATMGAMLQHEFHEGTYRRKQRNYLHAPFLGFLVALGGLLLGKSMEIAWNEKMLGYLVSGSSIKRAWDVS